MAVSKQVSNGEVLAHEGNISVKKGVVRLSTLLAPKGTIMIGSLKTNQK